MALSEKGKQSPKGKGRSAAGEINQPDLPYRIELWHDDRFERVLALAAHAGPPAPSFLPPNPSTPRGSSFYRVVIA
jgi:hypothetical protein